MAARQPPSRNGVDPPKAQIRDYRTDDLGNRRTTRDQRRCSCRRRSGRAAERDEQAIALVAEPEEPTSANVAIRPANAIAAKR